MKGRAITCSCNNAQLAWMEGPLTPAWCDIINSCSPESWLGRLPRQYTSHLDAKNLKAFSKLKMSIKCIKHTERENLVTLCWCSMTASLWIIVLQILRMVAANKRYLRDVNRLQVRKSCKGFLSPREVPESGGQEEVRGHQTLGWGHFHDVVFKLILPNIFLVAWQHISSVLQICV